MGGAVPRGSHRRKIWRALSDSVSLLRGVVAAQISQRVLRFPACELCRRGFRLLCLAEGDASTHCPQVPHCGGGCSDHLNTCGASCLTAAQALLLSRWTSYRAEGAKHAAVAGLWPQQRVTVPTFIEEQAGIRRHGFPCSEGAVRAGQHRLEYTSGHDDADFTLPHVLQLATMNEPLPGVQKPSRIQSIA